MDKTARTRLLLSELNQIWNDTAYYDDETDSEVFDYTEEQLYDIVMAVKEIHFLGSKFVKGIVHMMLNDWQSFTILSIEFEAI